MEISRKWKKNFIQQIKKWTFLFYKFYHVLNSFRIASLTIKKTGLNSYRCTRPKVHFFVRVWVFSPRRSRGLTGEDKRHFIAEVHIKFFKWSHELQSKRRHWKNYTFIYNPREHLNKKRDILKKKIRWIEKII
jgi:hypothetical protein